MVADKILTTSDDGRIEYVAITKDRLDEAITVLKKSFFPYENICNAVGLSKNPEAIDEIDDFMINIAKDGVSVAAIDKETGKAAAVILNKIQHKDTSSKTLFEGYIKNAKYSETKGIYEFLSTFEDSVDPFTPYGADCLMELVFLGVLPEYSRRGIGLKLSEISIELGTELLKGNNIKTSLDGSQLPLEPRPQVVTALFTSFKTQNIGRKLNFDKLLEVSYEDLYYNGHSYASVIGSDTKYLTIESKKLG